MPHNKTMRITGGTLVRRRFLVPPMVDEGSVRPTPDRVREAVFSMIKDNLTGAFILDICAGSGAHGFEALSRGARFVQFVEKDPRVAAVIKENIASLGLVEHTKVECADALKLAQFRPLEKAHVIFLDPPYSLKLEQEFFSSLHTLLADEGIIIYRCYKKEMPPLDENFEIVRDRIYGGTRVYIIKAKKPPLRT